MIFVLFIQIISTAMMVAIIWVIQTLHYPSFQFIDKNKFLDFHTFHSRQITYIVMPLMLMEIATAAYIILLFNYNKLLIVNFILLIAIWLITFFISVPKHSALSSGKNKIIINLLISTNWFRTCLWTLRLIILTTYLYYFVA